MFPIVFPGQVSLNFLNSIRTREGGKKTNSDLEKLCFIFVYNDISYIKIV